MAHSVFTPALLAVCFHLDRMRATDGSRSGAARCRHRLAPGTSERSAPRIKSHVRCRGVVHGHVSPLEFPASASFYARPSLARWGEKAYSRSSINNTARVFFSLYSRFLLGRFFCGSTLISSRPVVFLASGSVVTRLSHTTRQCFEWRFYSERVRLVCSRSV